MEKEEREAGTKTSQVLPQHLDFQSSHCIGRHCPSVENLPLLLGPRAWNGWSPRSGQLSKHRGIDVAVSSMLLHLERVFVE